MPRRKRRYLLYPALAGLLVALVWVLLAPKLPYHFAAVSSIWPPAQFAATQVTYADAVDRVMPAIVSIYVDKTTQETLSPLLDDPHYQELIKQNLIQVNTNSFSLGSGIIIGANGQIVTNHHIIASAEQIKVVLDDGRVADAQLIGSDPATDLAVLEISLDRLQYAELSNQDNFRVGDVVLAIGNPHGFSRSVSMGIISGIGIDQLGQHTFENYIQTDASINQGSSGGPLINSEGNIIGINTALFFSPNKSRSVQGLGFAIPASSANQVVQEILDHGHVVRGWLGIEVDLARKFTPDYLARLYLDDQVNETMRVSGVYVGGPAFKAGLRPDDLITHINGHLVLDPGHIMNEVANLKPGSKLAITYQRDDVITETQAILVNRPLSQ